MRDPPQQPFDFSSEFLRHHRSLWLVAMSVVSNREDADDTLQDAAIIGIRKSHDFTPGTSFRAWMGEIVRNVALNRRRQLRREARRFGHAAFSGAPDPPGRPPTPPAIAADGSVLPGQESLDDRMLHALLALEPTPRACILLRCIEGLEYAEISQLLDIPKGTAMSHVFRCRRTLAGILAPANEASR